MDTSLWLPGIERVSRRPIRGRQVLLEQGVGHAAVGPAGPHRVDLHEMPLLVLPVRVGDPAAIEQVRMPIDVLAVGQQPDRPLGRHRIEVRIGDVVVERPALGRAAAAIGAEHDVAVGTVGGLEVVPVGMVGPLLQAAAVQTDFKQVDRLVPFAQLIRIGAFDLRRRRILVRRPLGLPGVAEHHAVGVPPQVEASDVSRSQGPWSTGRTGAPGCRSVRMQISPPGLCCQAKVRVMLRAVCGANCLMNTIWRLEKAGWERTTSRRARRTPIHRRACPVRSPGSA